MLSRHKLMEASYSDRFAQCFENTSEVHVSLCDFALELHQQQGKTRQEIYDIFHTYYKTANEAQQDLMADVMDRIHGFCSPHSILPLGLPEYL